MKQNLKRTALILTPVILLCLTLIVSAAPGRKMARKSKQVKKTRVQRMKRPGGAKNFREPWKEMNFTPKQQKQIEDIRYKANLKKADLRAAIEKAHIKLKHEIDQNNINKDKVLKLTEVIGKLQIKIRKISILEKIDIKNLMTPQQKEKAKKIRGNFLGMKRHHDFGRMGEGPGIMRGGPDKTERNKKMWKKQGRRHGKRGGNARGYRNNRNDDDDDDDD